jgi:peptidoglycan glycosyltransferase
MAAAAALLLNLSYLQVFGQEKLRENPANTRRILEEYSIARGRILAADGTVLARSVEGEGPFRYRREYPWGTLLCHVLGYDSPQLGRTGLEEYYNDFLLGRKPARTWVEEMTGDRGEGYDLVTTLDLEVQQAAAEALGGRKGAVVAVDPATGAVLAMYSWPGYDPNLLVSQARNEAGGLVSEESMGAYLGDPSSPLLNRAAMGLYPPGSSFKVVTASAALEAGISGDKTYNCPGVLPVDGSRVVNYGSPPRDFGVIDMDAALTYSVNTYFAQLALELGADRLTAAAEAFGFNGVIPLDYPSVARCSIPQASQMDAVELAWTGAGQGELLVSPLQLCLVGCAVAERGRIMRPHLMKDIRSGEEILERFEIGTWRTPISPTTASMVLAMMEKVVERGTGTAAAIPGVSVAGKTGTAEVEGKPNHTWFLGIAPVEDPRVVVAVVVEHSGGGGGSVAAPIARRVMEAALR